jgi:hypothetical protein
LDLHRGTVLCSSGRIMWLNLGIRRRCLVDVRGISPENGHNNLPTWISLNSHQCLLDRPVPTIVINTTN